MKIPILHGPYGVDVYQNSTTYGQPDYSGGTADFVGTSWRGLQPCAGKYSHHLVAVETVPAPGQSMTFRLMVGAAPKLSITLTQPDDNGADLVNEADVVAGDLIHYQAIGSVTCGNTIHKHSLIFEPTTPGQMPFMGAHSVSAGTDWVSLTGHSAGGTETRAHTLIPIPGKIKNLYLKSLDGVMTGDCTFTLKKNGIAQSLARTLPAGGTDASDLLHEVSVAAGDYVHFEVVSAASDVVAWGVVFEADDPTQWFITSARGRVSLGSSAAYYNWINGGTLHTTTNQWQTAETSAGLYDRRVLWPNGPKITGMWVILSAAPGAGKSRIITLRNTGNPTAVAVTIADLATSGNVSGFMLEPADGDLMSLIAEKTGAAPTGATPLVALIGTSATTTLTSVTPNQGARKATMDVVLAGDNMTTATDVSFEGSDITVNSFTVDSDEQITANITIAADAACGALDVRVQTALNIVTTTDAFTVIPAAPVITSVTPSSGVQGTL